MHDQSPQCQADPAWIALLTYSLLSGSLLLPVSEPVLLAADSCSRWSCMEAVCLLGGNMLLACLCAQRKGICSHACTMRLSMCSLSHGGPCAALQEMSGHAAVISHLDLSSVLLLLLCRSPCFQTVILASQVLKAMHRRCHPLPVSLPQCRQGISCSCLHQGRPLAGTDPDRPCFPACNPH